MHKHADYAPGLPSRENRGNPQRLPLDTILTLVRQRHNADRAGLHEDLRIGDPGGLESWAVPKFLPLVENSKRLAIPQPVHRFSYKDFQGRIGKGYGSGDVEKIEESPVILVKNTPSHMMWTRGDTKDAPMYDMIRTKNGNWLLSIKKKGQPVQVKEYEKEHFKSVPMDKIPELVSNGAVAYEKIDGAGAIATLGKDGVRVFGIRNDKSGNKPEYTDYIGQGLRQAKMPMDLYGTMLRGELYGTSGGKTISATELSGLLNSTLRNATYKRQGDGIKLMLAALAVNNGQDDYDNAKVKDIVSRLNVPSIHTLKPYSGNDVLELAKRMQQGKDRLTSEGLVLHQPGKRPVKAKFTGDSDVVIRDIFPAEQKSGVPRAGGFSYSLPGREEIVGNVGSGMEHKLLQDMLANPDSYIGRTARITAQEQYPSGAYRAPRFVAMKED